MEWLLTFITGVSHPTQIQHLTTAEHWNVNLQPFEQQNKKNTDFHDAGFCTRMRLKMCGVTYNW